MTQTRAAFAAAVRPFAPDGRLVAAHMPAFIALADALGLLPDGAPAALSAANGEPAWTVAARSKIGTAEIPGPKHNPWILAMWKRVGVTWFGDDETAWCGGFMAWCMAEAGIASPPKGELARAAAWASWGIACRPQLGAIGVKRRTGGNHVFQIVGETRDKRFFKALGGNQRNKVSIVDIAKADAFAIRWPPGVAEMHILLPVLPAGTISTNEA